MHLVITLHMIITLKQSILFIIGTPFATGTCGMGWFNNLVYNAFRVNILSPVHNMLKQAVNLNVLTLSHSAQLLCARVLFQFLDKLGGLH
jgi:hypothetical protein